MNHAPHPFDVICFDCDSTLTRIEGIDELALRAGIAHLIEPLTTAAMDGSLALDEVYGRRMDLIRPDREALDWVAERYVAELVPGAAETVAALQALGKDVHIVSGGLLQPVRHLGAVLGIAADHIHAVDVLLDTQGRYQGYDQASKLTQAHGKAAIVAALAVRSAAEQQARGAFGPRRVALVGDGITDVRASEGGAFVIGFGGVVSRPAVVAAANVFVPGPSLTAILPFVLTSDENI